MDKIEEFSIRYNDFFSCNLNDIRRRESKNIENLNIFLNKFSLENMKKISDKDFVFEKGKDNSFCYWVEYNLKDLGDVRIQGQNQYQKYGIQIINNIPVYLKKGQKKSKFGRTADEVITKIKEEVCKLIVSIKNNNIQEIKENELYEVFKAKLTYLYCSDKWIPICTKPNVESLLDYFEIPYNKKESLTEKRVLLFQFYLRIKNTIPYITTWEFMHFLYSDRFYRKVLKFQESQEDDLSENHSENLNENEENEKINTDDCDLLDFNGTYFDARFPEHPISSAYFEKTKESKINYQKRQERNERIGKIGEKLICNDEMSKLHNFKSNNSVDYIASKDDSKGYDIVSFDEKGKKIYIEVKTTKTKNKDCFYLTDNEKKQILNYKDCYKIYRVFNLDLKNKSYNVVIYDGSTIFSNFNLIQKRFLCVFKKCE